MEFIPSGLKDLQRQQQHHKGSLDTAREVSFGLPFSWGVTVLAAIILDKRLKASVAELYIDSSNSVNVATKAKLRKRLYIHKY